MNLKEFLTSEKLVKSFFELSGCKVSKFEMIQVLKKIITGEIEKGKDIDPYFDIKNRSYQMLERVLNKEESIANFVTQLDKEAELLNKEKEGDTPAT